MNCQNQLCVDNPADFRNHEADYFQENKDSMKQKGSKESLNSTKHQNGGKLLPPAPPKRGILKRGQLMNKIPGDQINKLNKP